MVLSLSRFITIMERIYNGIETTLRSLNSNSIGEIKCLGQKKKLSVWPVKMVASHILLYDSAHMKSLE